MAPCTSATTSSFFNKFLSLLLLLLLLHLGCFIFITSNQIKKRKPKPKPLSPSSRLINKPHKALSSSWSYLKRIFSSTTTKNINQTHPSSEPPTALTSARSSQHSLVSMVQPDHHHHQPLHISDISPSDHNSISDSSPDSDNLVDHPFFPLRNDIFPCTACGEIFQKPHLLEQHQAIKHAVSELLDGDSGKNIVNIIFKTGWSNREKTPQILRILKIHNSPKILSRFEEYREVVKAKAARNGSLRRRDERCIADGNELLRFYCSTFCCELGRDGNSSICTHQYCSVCGIIKSGFSPKLDGISTLSTSWRAHVAIPEDVEQDFEFMNVKRAMLVCRVVAGRVGSDGDVEDDVAAAKEDGGYDSVVGRSCNTDNNNSGPHPRLDDDEELLVFNPRAVLPCFVIVHTVSN